MANYEAEAVAEALHEEFYEAMLVQCGEALSFCVVRDPGSGYVQIRMGEMSLWDTEDDNDSEEQTFPVILAHCKKRLGDIADMFSVFNSNA